MDSKIYQSHKHLLEYTERTWSYQTQSEMKRQLSRFNTTDRYDQLRNICHHANIQTWQCAVHVFMADAIGFSWKASKNGLTNLTNDNVTELDNARLPQLLTTEIYGD